MTCAGNCAWVRGGTGSAPAGQRTVFTLLALPRDRVGNHIPQPAYLAQFLERIQHGASGLL